MKRERQSNNIGILIGEPCTGKSAIMTSVLQDRKRWSYNKVGLIPYHQHRRGVIVLGRYDEEHQFPGTDRMSMAVQPKAMDFIRDTSNPILFEGDRLGTVSMIDYCVNLRGREAVKVFVTTTVPAVLNKRRLREREQSETFLKSRATKIANIIKAMDSTGVSYHLLGNNTLVDLDANMETLREWVGLPSIKF